MLGFYVEAVDVVKPAVPGFGNDRKRPPVPGGIGLAVIDAPLNHGVADDADAVRVGDHDGAFEESGFFDPGGAGHFTVSVLRKPSGDDGIGHGIFPARKNGGDAGADGAFSDLESSVAGNQSGVADEDAGNVGDGVVGAGSAVERNAEVAGARFVFFLSSSNKGANKNCD